MSKEKTHYMMATKAIHKLGDISREKPNLCAVYNEDEENYIGNWVTGFGFFDVKFPKETTRELTDEEEEKYNDMQIVIGSNPPFRIYTKESPKKISEESPTITLPDDEERKKQLVKKLKEYKGRIDSYRHPSLQMGTICKIAVLLPLLKNGKVDTHELSLKMKEKYGQDLNVDKFNNACGVINDYCETGGVNVSLGTGLN